MSAIPIFRSSSSPVSTQDPIRATLTAEIVIALCGPMGTPLHDVASVFKRLLLGQEYKYKSAEIIRMSDAIRDSASLAANATTEDLIKAGNDLRETHGPEVLARMAIEKIAIARAKLITLSDPTQN